MIQNAARVAAETGCAVEIDKATGNVRVLPPNAIPAHPAGQGGNSCDALFQGESG
jgi:hypothetical protein